MSLYSGFCDACHSGGQKCDKKLPKCGRCSLLEFECHFSEFRTIPMDPKDIVVRRNTFQLIVGDEEEVERFYVTRFKDLQQFACQLIAKVFIKCLEPKKQAHFPYHKGNISAPPWWPPLNSVRHREPEHLLKPGE